MIPNMIIKSATATLTVNFNTLGKTFIPTYITVSKPMALTLLLLPR